MQKLSNYILEKLKIDKDSKVPYKYQPKDKWELKEVLRKCMYERGNDADLNDIDVSQITDMEGLFDEFKSLPSKCEPKNIDISKWDVSHVNNMDNMFKDLHEFSCDLSKWNVSKVEDFHSTFYGCKNFNSDLSKWDVSSAKTIQTMFADCENFESDLSDWNVENLKEASGAFIGCTKLDFNIDAWNPKNLYDVTMWNMFKDSGFKKLPKWYKKYK